MKVATKLLDDYCVDQNWGYENPKANPTYFLWVSLISCLIEN